MYGDLFSRRLERIILIVPNSWYLETIQYFLVFLTLPLLQYNKWFWVFIVPSFCSRTKELFQEQVSLWFIYSIFYPPLPLLRSSHWIPCDIFVPFFAWGQEIFRKTYVALVCASSFYRPLIMPGALKSHRILVLPHFVPEHWSFSENTCYYSQCPRTFIVPLL